MLGLLSLQAKQRLLTGGGEGTVGSGEGPVLAQEKQQQSGSASGTPTVTGAAALPAAFSYGLQLQDDSQQLTQQPTKRPASPNGSGACDEFCSVDVLVFAPEFLRLDELLSWPDVGKSNHYPLGCHHPLLSWNTT